MILWELFITFFQIGLFTFGGGYAMIPLVLENVTAKGWMTEELFYQLIGICESTPGPIAVNMATFVGSDQAGFWGSVCATLGVVTPSFVIILIVASLFRNFSGNFYVQAAFKGMRPVIFALIGSTGLVLALKNVLPAFPSLFPQGGTLRIDWFLLILTAVLFFVQWAWKKWRKTKISPILLIAFAALCGMIFG